MASQRTFAASLGWVQVDSVLVIEVMPMGSIVNHSKFSEFIPVGEFMEVRTLTSGWLAYRIHETSIDGDIVATGYLAPWRVVQIDATT